MILLNTAILGLIIYEMKNLIVNKKIKEIIVYMALSISAIILEILCLISSNGKSLFEILLGVFGINH